jgi:hypothetical protein
MIRDSMTGNSAVTYSNASRPTNVGPLKRGRMTLQAPLSTCEPFERRRAAEAP